MTEENDLGGKAKRLSKAVSAYVDELYNKDHSLARTYLSLIFKRREYRQLAEDLANDLEIDISGKDEGTIILEVSDKLPFSFSKESDDIKEALKLLEHVFTRSKEVNPDWGKKNLGSQVYLGFTFFKQMKSEGPA